MAMSLAGKTAIVTGAGSGINLAFARLLLSKQCNVLFADLALRPEAQELVSNHYTPSRAPAKAFFQKTDVRDWGQLDRMFKVARQEFGDEGVDIVCPGAGVFEPPWSSFWHPPSNPPSLDHPSTSRYALLDINLTHPIRTTQLALSRFLSSHPRQKNQPRPRKHILHISSIAAQTSPFLAPLYSASKHAISGFVRTLAPLDTLGIRVTAVAPGIIRTPLFTDNPEKLRLVSREDAWVAPESVAEAMGDLITKEEIEIAANSGAPRERISVRGGLVLEVAKGGVREVRQFGDEGPSREMNTVSGVGMVEEEILRELEGGGWGGG